MRGESKASPATARVYGCCLMKSRVQLLADITEKTTDDLKESIMFLRVQSLIWRDVAIISTFNPVRGRDLARNMVAKFIPYGGGDFLESMLKFHNDLMKEAQEVGLVSGVFDFHGEKRRGRTEQRRWVRSLQAAAKEALEGE